MESLVLLVAVSAGGIILLTLFGKLINWIEKRKRKRKLASFKNNYSQYSRVPPVRTGYAYRPASYDEDDGEDEDDYGDRRRVQATGIIIRHPHVIEPDDFECSVCGRRFPKSQAECPYCNARFTGRKTDDMEFLEEEDELESWDEEEGW